jgi:isoaspartyl peptidase/L-asparaginase-like protein (Ntn-hydrolase superfamily)
MAVGDSDILVKTLPSLFAVAMMENGKSPSEAAAGAVRFVLDSNPTAIVAVIAVSEWGEVSTFSI